MSAEIPPAPKLEAIHAKRITFTVDGCVITIER